MNPKPKPPLDQYFSEPATLAYDEKAIITRRGWCQYWVRIEYRLRIRDNSIPDADCIKGEYYFGSAAGAERRARRMMRQIRLDNPAELRRGQEWTVTP